MIEMKRYPVAREALAPWINFFWVFQAANARVCHKLLPTDSIDVIVNLGAPMRYRTDQEWISAPGIHINGLRGGYSYIAQEGPAQVFGISFQAYGLYPFVHCPLTGIRDSVVDLHSVDKQLAGVLEQAVGPKIEADCIPKVERTLLDRLKVDDAMIEKCSALQRFIAGEEPVDLAELCRKYGMHPKALQRFCKGATGYPPTVLRRLCRFQKASNRIVHQDSEDLAGAAYASMYADQAHFTREFKALSGEPPRAFQRQRASIKENVTYK